MISNQASIGDLVYIPSEVLMTNYKTFIKTDKPINAICVGKKSVEIKVFYAGSSWWVNKSKVYSIGG
jgi:hypothetical protein